MRALLLLMGLGLYGCGASTSIRRSMLGVLPPTPTAQVLPSDFASIWAGAQSSPFPTPTQANGKTGIMVPAVQPEFGTLFLTAQRHLVVGVNLHFSHPSWGHRSNADQPPIPDGLMFGVRSRIGTRFDLGDTKLGVLASMEPGFDYLPWATNVSRGSSGHVMPELSGNVALTYSWDRVQAHLGLTAASTPALRSQITTISGCTGCAAPGWDYAALGAVEAGIRVNISTGWAVSASVTVPFTLTEPQYMPMFSLTVLRNQSNSSDVSQPPPPPVDAPAPPPPPPLPPPPLSPETDPPL